jgi:hypothetical protein
MLLHIVVHTKLCLSENKTLSPFRVIFLLQRPCLCPLHIYVLISEQLPEDGQVEPKLVAIDVILMLF